MRCRFNSKRYNRQIIAHEFKFFQIKTGAGGIKQHAQLRCRAAGQVKLRGRHSERSVDYACARVGSLFVGVRPFGCADDDEASVAGGDA